MDVGGWLRGLGLGQYEEQFRDNKIDADVLPRLTVDDLKDIGVSVVGDRRRLLDAIAVIAGAGPASPAKSTPSKGLQASAERRPITVMFCDLVGSTSLAARLDAEDWRNIVNAYLDEASAAVTGFGGHVLKKLGDGLMALFGYPYAQKNDAERAVRAALAIQRALVEINASNAANGAPALSARIGIECGPAVVEASGEVFGDAPNVAARVQAAAEPGSVLVTVNVQRQVAGLFVAEEQGPRELRGLSEPVQLFRIVRASGGGRRGGARVQTAFIGREEELGLLARRWDRARAGEGQLVLVVGEPGLGKSRLIEEFHARLAETPHTWVEWSASQLLQNTPLHPIVEWGRLRFGADASAEQRLADLEGTLRLIGLDPTEHAPLVAPLVDIPLPPSRTTNLSPEELRRRQLTAMAAWVLAGARTQPAVIAFEDLHWADPTSLDLMRALAERGTQASLLIIATTRPEFRPPWSVRSHHSVISLSPLDRVQVAKMVSELSAHHALPKDIVAGVSARTGGVPLFVEEVTRFLLERGEQGGAQAIPPTLQQSLAARLDRLGSARETAQIGAVLGRGFSFALLQSVAGLDEGALQSALERLAQADILFIEGDGQHANYRFKHALIQDAAYDSLLKSHRQALHRRAAEVLAGQPERAAAEPEVIAHHFTQAGLDDLAIEWWGKAGDQALRRSAFQEAISHLGRAIAMADETVGPDNEQMPQPRSSFADRKRLQTRFAAAVMWTKGYAAEEAKEAFERVRELSPAGSFAEDPSETRARWVRGIVSGDLRAAQETARSYLLAAEQQGSENHVYTGCLLVGMATIFQGDFHASRTYLERALNGSRTQRGGAFSRTALDVAASAAACLALTSWYLGDDRTASRLIDEALREAEALGHAATRANALLFKVRLDARRANPAATVRTSESLLALGREKGMDWFVATGNVFANWARGRLFDSASGATKLHEALTAYMDHGNRIDTPFFHGLLADLEVAGSEAQTALTPIDRGLMIAAQTGEHWADAFLHRLRGEILLKCNPDDSAEAEEAFQTAVTVAKQQGARSYELLASLSLAKLHQSTGRPAEAYAVIAPALEGFAPTPEMPEIAEAQALLSALAKIERVREALEKRQTRTKIHLDYARAVQWAKGWGAEEARAAVERAHEFAAPTPGHPDYWSLAYGRFAVSLLRGEFRAALEIAETYLRQAQVEGRPDHAVNARRLLGTVKLELGAFFESRQEFEKLLEDWDEDRDKGLRAVTGADVLCVGWAYMAQLMVILGEVDDAVRMSEGAIRRAESLGDFGSLAFALGLSLFVLATCGRNEATLRTAEAFEAKASEKGARLWESIAKEWASIARGLITGDAAGAATELRDIMAARHERQERQSAYMGHGVLAQLHGKAGAIDAALASIADGLALAEQTRGHRADSFLHRARGDVLAERDPAAAETSYREALRIAQSQGARTFELQAAHALAKLYRSTDRPADAHAILAPALEGFSSTPEMPEIAEAQALLAALAETDEVKADEARRHQLTQLHVSYGNALIAARGYGARETTEAFARARESTAGDKDAPGRLSADYGLWVGSFTRGELPSMQAHSSDFLNDVQARPDSPETGVARRVAGATCWFAGEYREAKDHLERALALFQPGRDDDLAVRFGQDQGVPAMAYLALVLWPLGEIDRAASFMSQMLARIASLTQGNTIALGHMFAAQFALMHGGPMKGKSNFLELARIASAHDLAQFRAFGMFFDGWARVENDLLGGLDGMRLGIDSLRARNILIFDGLVKIALAKTEAEAGDQDRAVAILNEALRTADGLGHRTFEAELHRARGDILLQRDPANSAPAEEAFLRAIAVAKRQGARSFELRAALALSKLYRSAGRLVDAQAVLAPALEGFAPTDEMPEIAEAQALLLAIEASAHARHQ